MTTISQSLTQACQIIDQASPSPRIDSEVLLCHVLNCNTAHLVTWPDKILDKNDETKFKQLIQKRLSGTPVAYLTGEKEFWSLKLNVSNDTLIPRPETELIIEAVLEKFSNNKQLSLIDLGTGSGAIAIALAHNMPHWNITATDISKTALELAANNANNLQLSNIDFIQSDWFDSFKNQLYDIVISNPPYIAEGDPHLNVGDVRFEPQSALTSGKTGMDDIVKITSQATKHLDKDGWLILEHGYNQKQQVFNCLTDAGYHNIMQYDDLAGNPRMSMAQFTTQ